MALPPSFISIITINYNQLEVTCEMLASIQSSTYSHYEIIVVDNASDEDPGSYLAEKFPQVRFIRSEKNLGFSGGNNLGIRASKGEYLFFVNNDTEFTPDLLQKLLDLFRQIPDLGAVSPKILYHPEVAEGRKDLIQYLGTTPVNPYTARNRTIGEGETDRGQYDTARPTAYVHGAAMMIPRRVIEEVGFMPEFFFLYYEELDWSERIRRAGYHIYVEPTAAIYHKESISIGKESTLKTYYLNRNRILFMRRNRSWGQLLIFSLFLLFFTVPKNVILFLLKGQAPHALALLRAIGWNLSHSSEEEQALPRKGRRVEAPTKTEIEN